MRTLPRPLLLLLLAVLVLAIAIPLTSCRPKPTPPPGTGPTGTTGPSTSSAPASGEPIKIGAILPLTGDAAAYGKSAREGMELALSDLNARGGVGGRPLSVVYEDSKGSPKDGVAGFDKLATQDHVPAVVGDLLSSVTLAVAPAAERRRVVLLSPTSTAPALSDAGDFIFRNCPSDVYEGKVMADYATADLHLKNVGILAVANDYGNGIAAVFKAAFAAQGGSVPVEETYPQGATDVRAQLTKLSAARVEAIYLVGYKELGRILKQAAELRVVARYLSTVMFEDPEVLSTAGPAAEGVVYSSPSFDINSDEPTVKAFRERYQAAYARSPDIFAAASYDAVGIIGKAMASGATTGDAIRDALYATRDYPGVIGSTSFDAKGDATQPAVLKTIEGGSPVRLVAPG